LRRISGQQADLPKGAVIHALQPDGHDNETREGPGGKTRARRRPAALDDPDALAELYLGRGLSLRAVAADLGCSRKAVGAALERHGIARRRPSHHPVELDSRRWLRHAYLGQGRSAHSIAAELGCSPKVVVSALHRLRIPTRPKRPQTSARLGDGEWLRQRYGDERMSIVAVANELGCSPGAVRRALHRHDIDVRPYGAPRIDQLYDVAWLRRARKRFTPAQMADRLGCSEVTVRSALWRSGIPPGRGTPARPPELDDAAYLLAEYVHARRSARSIATELGCAPATVLNALRRQGIAVRSPVQQADVRALWPPATGSEAGEQLA
jgi:DNA-directed RNA polymerase specialized sigma24 family protein